MTPVSLSPRLLFRCVSGRGFDKNSVLGSAVHVQAKKYHVFYFVILFIIFPSPSSCIEHEIIFVKGIVK